MLLKPAGTPDGSPSLLERKILFFGGKGGVGKTTLAAASALAAADAGRKTLLVSTDPAHSTGDVLDADLGPEPKRVEPSLWAMEIDPEREADRYIAQVKERVAEVTAPNMAREVDRQIDIARLSPGAQESALFSRFTRIIDGSAADFDHILFDTAPTGHTLRLLSLPEHMSAWIDGLIRRRRKMGVLQRMWRNVAGAAAGDDSPAPDPVLDALEERKSRFERTRAVVTDPARTAFMFVTIPERLAIAETEKAVAMLDRHRIPIGAVLVNRVVPGAAEGPFLRVRRERESSHLERIERSFADHPIHTIPLFETDVAGVPALRKVAATLPRSRPRG